MKTLTELQELCINQSKLYKALDAIVECEGLLSITHMCNALRDKIAANSTRIDKLED